MNLGAHPPPIRLEMTADTLTLTLWETLSQEHPVRPDPASSSTETCEIINICYCELLHFGVIGYKAIGNQYNHLCLDQLFSLGFTHYDFLILLLRIPSLVAIFQIKGLMFQSRPRMDKEVFLFLSFTSSIVGSLVFVLFLVNLIFKYNIIQKIVSLMNYNKLNIPMEPHPGHEMEHCQQAPLLHFPKFLPSCNQY